MYDSESDEPTKLKVVDRRLFDSEGNLREDVTVEEPAADEVHPAPDNAAPLAKDPAQRGTAEVSPTDPVPSEGPAETEQPLKFGQEALMRFVEEQYIGGLLALGAMPEPQTGQVVEDLDLAQVRIEILALLQERAGDSLPPEAKKGLDDVIYQLRMAYLQKSKVAKL